MPDVLGRYTLAEMRDRTRRILKGTQSVVDTTTGLEVPPADLNPLFSNEDLNFFINSAITSTWTDCVLNTDTLFADEEFIDIKKDISEYPLPDDLAQLRGLWWKEHSIAFRELPLSRRRFMHLLDEAFPEDHFEGAPTYRRAIGSIWLNHPPRQDNPGGILIRYIKHSIFLDQDENVLETEFAKVMQEVVIREAACEAMEDKSQLDTTILRGRVQEWKQRLMVLVRNNTNPPFVKMVTHERKSWQHPKEKFFA